MAGADLDSDNLLQGERKPREDRAQHAEALVERFRLRRSMQYPIVVEVSRLVQDCVLCAFDTLNLPDLPVLAICP